ncbi:MAG: MBL fold metallo-hydrolase [Clostridia bacterium]|nr:MBL fold metallo-hydrolase [Clostridia bacterium]
MAKKKETSRKKEREREKKARRVFTVIVVILLIIAVVGTYILWKKGYIELDFADGHDHNEPQQSIVTDELSIHFPMLGNKYSGDCTLIKVGNTEILIDAGSRKNSAETLISYINTYCTDGVLEYVIATHADQDHIAAFVGLASGVGIFEAFKCGTIIDFPRTNSTSGTYEDYVALRDAEVEAGATHYTALECWNNENGAKRSYELADGITMNFLYQKFYEQKASDENNYSVCMLLTQGTNNYLFTGDLEAEGEASLVEEHELPKCKLFKAGHHGSPTSSGAALLAEIQPEIVCVCCCCGNDTEYNFGSNDVVFPSQAVINRIAVYTERIYIPTLVAKDTDDGFVPMNGNIIVSSDGGEVKVTCSNNDTLLKDTDWFKANRTWPTA